MVANKGTDKIFNIFITVSMSIFSLIIMLPLLHVIASSFSSPQAVYTGKVTLFPVDFSLESYARVFAEESIWRGYINTIIYTIIGTIITLVLQMTAGYSLSHPELKFKGFFTLLFVITMFIGGGMIPSYIIMKNLKLLNTMWAIILPGALSAYNVIIVRTYIKTAIPSSLQEAAMIDGCGPLRTFWAIVIPLSRPIIAVMCLYAIVGLWNSYFNALIYVTDVDKQPLQMVLRKILITNQSGIGSGGDIGSGEAALLSEALKFSTIVVSCLPIMMVYPFFEKYFEKGMIVGSIKG